MICIYEIKIISSVTYRTKEPNKLKFELLFPIIQLVAAAVHRPYTSETVIYISSICVHVRIAYILVTTEKANGMRNIYGSLLGVQWG